MVKLLINKNDSIPINIYKNKCQFIVEYFQTEYDSKSHFYKLNGKVFNFYFKFNPQQKQFTLDKVEPYLPKHYSWKSARFFLITFLKTQKEFKNILIEKTI